LSFFWLQVFLFFRRLWHDENIAHLVGSVHIIKHLQSGRLDFKIALDCNLYSYLILNLLIC
jgi:hypothetical protein